MSKITDAQVEVAEGAYLAVLCNQDYDEKLRPVPANPVAMRAALEAYERVRDINRILSPANDLYERLAEQQERQP